MPAAKSALDRLVRQIDDLQRTQSYATFAAFIRGGDVHRWLCRELNLSDEDMTAVLVDLDNRQAEFLPTKIDDIAPRTRGKLRGIFEFVKTQVRKRSARALLGSIVGSHLPNAGEAVAADGWLASPSRDCEEGVATDLPNKWKLHLPIPPTFRELKAMSPSRINDYLKCPFTYYLKDKTILGDKRMDDRATELQAWEYGNLAHEALEAFALSELKDATDAVAIRAFLAKCVDAQLAERFGTAVPAGVRLQGESVKGRLANFAEIQSARRAAGWRIVAVERKMELPYSFTRSDGTMGTTRLHGKCDRIDFNEKTDEWCVIDYKTWDSADNAVSFRRQEDGSLEWRSLQLAIYCAMLDAADDAEFAAAKRDNITSCFCVLGKTSDQVCFTEPMTGSYLSQAEEKIREILVAIERGIFWPPSRTGEWRYAFADWLSPSPEETVDETWIVDQESRCGYLRRS